MKLFFLEVLTPFFSSEVKMICSYFNVGFRFAKLKKKINRKMKKVKRTNKGKKSFIKTK